MKIVLEKEYELELPGCNEYIYGVETASPIFCKTIGNNNIEYVGIICLDNTNKIINYSTVAMGTISKVNIQLSQLMKVALLSNASKIIIAHNHPSGVLQFTNFDIQMTKKIGTLSKFFGIELIDSIVVYGKDSKSIREYVGDEINGK